MKTASSLQFSSSSTSCPNSDSARLASLTLQSEEFTAPSAARSLSGFSMSAPQPSEEDCTIVESISTGHSIVPPPEAVPACVPECSRWAGEAFGEAVAQEVPVPLTQEKIVYKPVKQRVERPVERTRYVTKPIRKEVAEFRQVVTDEVIEVPKPYPVHTKVFVPNYVDHEKPCVVSQKYLPCLGSGPTVAVECRRFEPEVHFVDIKVPKIVKGHLEVNERKTRFLAVDKISKAQWNTLVFKLNPELCAVGDLTHLPVHRSADGSVIAFKKEVPVGIALSS